MKKIKLFVFSLAVLTLSLTIASAKEMTIDEIGQAAEKVASGSRYVFIIGKYAYTSNYTSLSLQDIMLASAGSTSSKNQTNSKDKLNTMTIYRIDRTYSGYNPTGWKLGTNEVGNGTDLSGSKKIDIEYIDYKKVTELQNTSNTSKDNTPITFLNRVISNYKVPYNKVLANRVSQRLFI